jgi:cytochrome c oxidase subunit 2
MGLSGPAGASGGFQSPLGPNSPAASDIADLAWLLFGGAALIFAAVLVLTGIAVFAPGRGRAWLRRRRSIVLGGLAFPIAVLSALLVYSLGVADRLVRTPEAAAVRIEVIGEQYWWRVRYLDETGRPAFETANEIHLPAGASAEFVLRSADVIHSFWLPNLAGKIDLIPGHATRLRVRPDRPGVFRGQCAEYCGAQHANMAFRVVVDTPDGFAVWFAAQRQPAPP